MRIKLADIVSATQTPLYTFEIYHQLIDGMTKTPIEIEVSKSTIPGERNAVIRAGLHELYKLGKLKSNVTQEKSS